MHPAHQSAKIFFMITTQRRVIFLCNARKNLFTNGGRIGADVRVIDVTRRRREKERDGVRALNVQAVVRRRGASAFVAREHGGFKLQSPSFNRRNQPVRFAALFPRTIHDELARLRRCGIEIRTFQLRLNRDAARLVTADAHDHDAVGI